MCVLVVFGDVEGAGHEDEVLRVVLRVVRRRGVLVCQCVSVSVRETDRESPTYCTGEVRLCVRLCVCVVCLGEIVTLAVAIGTARVFISTALP